MVGMEDRAVVRGVADEHGPPKSLYEACARMVVDKTLEDPLQAIRAKLVAYGEALAAKFGDPKGSWSVYVERHIAGVRFILRERSGRELDLSKLPPDPKELE